MKKVDLGFLKRNKKEIYFGLIGFILAVILIFIFVDSVGFLVESVDSALEIGSQSQSPTRFNIGALESLGLIEEETPTPAPPSSGATSSTILSQ
ncbi:MAG: hypothetical protein UV58_C0008G0015 [Candidatus Wolfebacteria bacterium GW2011_GWC1_43_10]|uniref:Uncharacterized protein n=2 Tax=Candidatus Wolfeibacteriota TaxID=1752735 RepID=A0A0G1F710_9BACT|nr:MAG: hypothetical protein UV58_C0008G0015 [Candidatus Wolfebacteria bacterium GW2011_GWC1_43_10]KKT22645.1 MAG: hypothetical protein UW08_C0005G0020 [Parcubacteria group bacterium GW2011_GWB1_43_8b]OGM89625.1 MAG: hypothetical protein A2108_01470 [Candidatus Wolfebacteria bacterium GWA1_42_9]